jgi:hypothetical protein
MALPKPQKDYYRLDEVAKEWGWTVDDILDYAKDGKIRLCVEFLRLESAEPVYYQVSIEEPESYRCTYDDNFYIEGVHQITADSIDALRYPNAGGKYITLNVVDPKKGLLIVKIFHFFDKSHPDFMNSITLSSLVLTHDEKIRFKRENLIPLHPEQPEQQPNLSVETDSCYIHGEKLITDKIMGDFLNMVGAPRPSWRTCKRWIKEVKLPGIEPVFVKGGPNKEYKLHSNAIPFLKKKYAVFRMRPTKNKK